MGVPLEPGVKNILADDSQIAGVGQSLWWLSDSSKVPGTKSSHLVWAMLFWEEGVCSGFISVAVVKYLDKKQYTEESAHNSRLESIIVKSQDRNLNIISSVRSRETIST